MIIYYKKNCTYFQILYKTLSILEFLYYKKEITMLNIYNMKHFIINCNIVEYIRNILNKYNKKQTHILYYNENKTHYN